MHGNQLCQRWRHCERVCFTVYMNTHTHIYTAVYLHIMLTSYINTHTLSTHTITHRHTNIPQTHIYTPPTHTREHTQTHKITGFRVYIQTLTLKHKSACSHMYTPRNTQTHTEVHRNNDIHEQEESTQNTRKNQHRRTQTDADRQGQFKKTTNTRFNVRTKSDTKQKNERHEGNA